jgi:hypothetical protein
MKYSHADDIQGKSNATNDHYQLWLLYLCAFVQRNDYNTQMWLITFDRHTPLYGLQKNANTKCKQEYAVEESTKKSPSLPSERQCWRSMVSL